MMRYDFLHVEMTITLDSVDPNQSAFILYQGEPDAVNMISGAISDSYGLYGSKIGDEATPLDLDFALQCLLGEGVYTLVDGQEILDRHKSLAAGCMP